MAKADNTNHIPGNTAETAENFYAVNDESDNTGENTARGTSNPSYRKDGLPDGSNFGKNDGPRMPSKSPGKSLPTYENKNHIPGNK